MSKKKIIKNLMPRPETTFREIKNINRRYEENNIGLVKRDKSTIIMIILSIFLLTSCGGLANYRKNAKKIALSADFKPILLRTSNFRLAAFYRYSKYASPLTVYIEGDGLAWLKRNRPSTNPTPKNPLVLKLATLDKSANVVYLARPCQYVRLSGEKLCGIPYWTQKRFSKEVIVAVNEAIDKLAFKAGAKRIHLVGYSGGGAVAALAASSRSDIASLRTLAGYMDHVSLNREVSVSPLKGSLDPIRAAPYLKFIPQIHYSGNEDERIPGWVAQNFRKAVGNNACTSVQKVNATHGNGWEKVWDRVWSKIPICH
jgi:hypothetical protein